MKEFKYMNRYEEEAYLEGHNFILGIDEVGRGPIAGEVTVAGVILDKKKKIIGLNDSKKLSKKKRQELSLEIKKKCLDYEIVSLSADKVDEIGISNAIREAVYELINNLSKRIKIDKILIDYMKIDLSINHLILKKGDANSNSIAAASIIAKVHRDGLLEKLDTLYPEYGFASHVGYGTKKHIEAIKKLGIIEGVHRKTFEPIKTFIKESSEKNN